MSSALTRGILVTVRTQYIPEKSSATARQYAFAYTVNIANRGTVTAKLESRHWIITDSEGDVQEVRGERHHEAVVARDQVLLQQGRDQLADQRVDVGHLGQRQRPRHDAPVQRQR